MPELTIPSVHSADRTDVVVDLYVDHNASGIIVVSNITSEMTPEISEVESTVIHGADCKPHSRY